MLTLICMRDHFSHCLLIDTEYTHLSITDVAVLKEHLEVLVSELRIPIPNIIHETP